MIKPKAKRLVIIVLAGLLLSGAGLWLFFTYYSINPLLERALRDQFGEAFFDDFSDLPEIHGDTAELEGIVAKYEPHFFDLEARALERLETLLESAILEYEQQKSSGTLDRFQLTNKYIQAGRLLENRVDESFYSLLSRMENELVRKSLPTGVIAEIEASYIESKTRKKQELLSYLREKIGS
jgi:hypothetical protein